MLAGLLLMVASGLIPVWSGTAPVTASDTAAYELGTAFTVSPGGADIAGVRVWNPGLDDVPGRVLRLWDGDTGLPIVDGPFPYDIPDDLELGWNEFVFDYSFPEGTYTVSYPVGGQGSNGYGATPFTAYSGGGIIYQLGLFGGTQGSYPGSSSTNFYGIDLLLPAAGGGGAAESPWDVDAVMTMGYAGVLLMVVTVVMVTANFVLVSLRGRSA